MSESILIYSSKMMGIPDLHIITDKKSAFCGWLMFKHPDGQLASLADLKPHIAALENSSRPPAPPMPPPSRDVRGGSAWPIFNIFNRKDKEPKIDYKKLNYERLQEFRKVGEEFNYLGVEMIVTGHSYFVSGEIGFHDWPSLCADYANKRGEIKHITFGMDELTGLINQNKEH